MSYRELYNYCQNLGRRPTRWDIIDKVVEMHGRGGRPAIQVVGYDPNILMGTIMWFVPDGHPMHGRCNGEPLIQVAREISRAWTRVVVVKEMMHYFDEPLEFVGNAHLFERLINEFANEEPEDSPAMISENVAYCRALILFCNEVKRQEYARRRSAGDITDEQIGRELILPTECVPFLFGPNFNEIVTSLLD